jgi:hypothetical protein
VRLFPIVRCGMTIGMCDNDQPEEVEEGHRAGCKGEFGVGNRAKNHLALCACWRGDRRLHPQCIPCILLNHSSAVGVRRAEGEFLAEKMGGILVWDH